MTRRGSGTGQESPTLNICLYVSSTMRERFVVLYAPKFVH